jgi:hypothetical protein
VSGPPASGGENIVIPAQQELVRSFAKLALMPEVAGALFLRAAIRRRPELPADVQERHADSGRQVDDHARHGRLQFACAGSGSARDSKLAGEMKAAAGV